MKKGKMIYGVWLTVLAVLLTGYSLNYDQMPLWGAGKTVGLLFFVMLDVLFALRMAAAVFWRMGVRQSDTSETADRAACARNAAWQLLIFVVGTAAEVFYCFGLAQRLGTDTVRDALTAGGLLCITILVSGHGHFLGEEERYPEEA